MLVYQLSKN